MRFSVCAYPRVVLLPIGWMHIQIGYVFRLCAHSHRAIQESYDLTQIYIFC